MQTGAVCYLILAWIWTCGLACSMFVCSETCCTTVQRARDGHRGNVDRAAMSGERGLSCSTVPLVPQQRGASPGPQEQPQVCQLFLQHQPWHWRPGKISTVLILYSITKLTNTVCSVVVPLYFLQLLLCVGGFKNRAGLTHMKGSVLHLKPLWCLKRLYIIIYCYIILSRTSSKVLAEN